MQNLIKTTGSKYVASVNKWNDAINQVQKSSLRKIATL